LPHGHSQFVGVVQRYSVAKTQTQPRGERRTTAPASRSATG
jgi:hypothetical protein